MIEPSDSQECLDFMRTAYEISEKFDVPVLLRTTTRVAHSKSLVSFGTREERPVPQYVRNPRKNIAAPANAMMNHPKLEKNMQALEEYACASPLNRMEINGGKGRRRHRRPSRISTQRTLSPRTPPSSSSG